MVVIKKHDGSHALLENANIKWYWDGWELIKFREMWKDGEPLEVIAKEFNTNLNSVAILVMDQEIEGKIKQRGRGLFGN